MTGGLLVSIKIIIEWDDEASVYIATCDELGLALESESYDSLVCRVRDAVPELLLLNNIEGCDAIDFLTRERRIACVNG